MQLGHTDGRTAVRFGSRGRFSSRRRTPREPDARAAQTAARGDEEGARTRDERVGIAYARAGALRSRVDAGRARRSSESVFRAHASQQNWYRRSCATFSVLYPRSRLSYPAFDRRTVAPFPHAPLPLTHTTTRQDGRHHEHLRRRQGRQGPQGERSAVAPAAASRSRAPASLFRSAKSQANRVRGLRSARASERRVPRSRARAGSGPDAARLHGLDSRPARRHRSGSNARARRAARSPAAGPARNHRPVTIETDSLSPRSIRQVQLRARPTAALKARPVVVAKARFGVFAAAVRIPPRSERPRARVAGPVRSRNNRNRPSRSRKFHS